MKTQWENKSEKEVARKKNVDKEMTDFNGMSTHLELFYA